MVGECATEENDAKTRTETSGALQEHNLAESKGEVAASRFEKFISEVFSERTAGFAFSRIWVCVVFFNATLIIDQTRAHETLDCVYLLSLVALVAILVVGGIAYRAFDRLSRNVYGRSAPAILSVLGTCALPFASVNEFAGAAAIVFSAIATGLGSGLFILFWGKIYGRVGGSIAIGDAAVAFTIATFPVPLFMLLPYPLKLAVVIVLAIGSAITLSHELDHAEDPEWEGAAGQDGASAGGQADVDAHAAKAHEPSREQWTLEVVNLSWKKVLAKLVASSLVFGCVISLVRTTCSGSGAGALNDEFVDLLPFVSIIGGVIMVALLLFSRQLDLAFTYKPIVILMTIGSISLPFIGNSSVPASVTAMAGYLCFEIMNWTILSNISYRFSLPAMRVFGFGRAATSGGVFVGAAIGMYLNLHVEYTSEFLMALAFALIFAMVITYTFTLTERDVAKITRQRGRHPFAATAGEGEPPHELTVDEKAEILANRLDITGRGREVLLLLAKGNSAARIEQELYMSKGTVNTHTRRLYQKLGVHKRQELIDMVDAVELEDDDLPL